MTPSRRTFLQGTAAMMAASAARLTSTDSLAARGESPRARPDDEIWIDALSATDVDEAGLAGIRQSGLTMLSITLGPAGSPTFSYPSAVADLARWHGHFDRHGDHLIHVRKADDILRAKREGKLGVMLNFQNGTHLNRELKNVDFFYDLGIRHIQLTYNEMNALGVGCTERVDAGLSDFGVAVVHRMNELGMLVDVSHCGFQTSLDAIDVSTKPIVFSHSNCKALNDNARCKTDEQIKKLVAKGGVMGITTVNFFVSKRPRSTVDDFIAHIDHVVKLVGVDHVGIGTDSSILGWRRQFPTERVFWDFHGQFKYKPGADVRWPPFIEELDGADKFQVIKSRLLAKGYSAADVSKILGANFLRVYRETIG